MLVISSDVHRNHHSLELSGSELVPSWDSPDRADLIRAALESAGHQFSDPGGLDHDLLLQVHSGAYIEFLSSAWSRWSETEEPGQAAIGFTWPARGMFPVAPDDLIGQLGYYSFAADCSIVEGTWDAASTSAAIAQTASDHVIDSSGKVRHVFALCRPPGHHASTDQFGGYCYLNNAAVAAQRFLDSGATRVAILDVDYHHGNGTQQIFYDRDDVLFVSIHADPKVEFPFFAGHADERGIGAGAGWNLNLPLPHGSDMATWSSALATGLEAIKDSGAEALIVSLGVDTFYEDPISKFLLKTKDFTTMSSRIGALGLPMVVVQEGGYAVEAIGGNVAAFLEGLS